jgi:hypothetical protein
MRRSLNLVAVALAAGLLTSACTSQAAQTSRSLPSGGDRNVVPSPANPTPSEPAPTQTPAKAVPAGLVGDWKVVTAFDVDMTKVRRASLSFYGPGRILPGWTLPTNGGANDGCNGSSLLAVIGPGASARIYPGVTTLMACSGPLVPLNKVFAETRTWGLSTGGGKTLLTFYDANQVPVGVFERMARP